MVHRTCRRAVVEGRRIRTLAKGRPRMGCLWCWRGNCRRAGKWAAKRWCFSDRAGLDVTGVLPFSRMKQFTVGARALTDTRVLRFPASLFPELIQKMPELTQRLVGLMSDRIRETTRREQQRDRLVSLGKLSAGLAHELNNPASAAKRAASQLRDTLKRIKDASHELGRRDLTAAQKSEIDKLEASFVHNEEPPPDALVAIERSGSSQIDSLLLQPWAERSLANGGGPGAKKREAGKSWNRCSRPGCSGHRTRGAREDRGFGWKHLGAAGRNRGVARRAFRTSSPLRHQGIHVHGSGARAKR